MTTLVEEVAKQYEAYRISVLTHIEEYKPEYTLEWARDVLQLIDSHPETLERRRRDFEAGRSLGLKRDMQRALSQHGMDGGSCISDQFDDYLAAEKYVCLAAEKGGK